MKEMIVPEVSAVVVRPDFRANVANVEATIAEATADQPLYLSLPSSNAHKGRWGLGADADPVPPTERFLLDPSTLEWGYTVFVAGRPVASTMRSMLSGGEAPDKPVVDELGNKLPEKARNDATLGYRVTMYRKDWRKVVLRGATAGLRFAITNLMEKVIERARDGNEYAPLVTLGVASYTHPAFGLVYTPKLHIENWADATQLPA